MDHSHDQKKSRTSNEIMDQIQDQRDYHQECALRQVMSRKRLQLSAARPYRGSWKRSRRKWKRSRSSKKKPAATGINNKHPIRSTATTTTTGLLMAHIFSCIF